MTPTMALYGAASLMLIARLCILRPDWVIACVTHSWYDESIEPVIRSWRLTVRMLGMLAFAFALLSCGLAL